MRTPRDRSSPNWRPVEGTSRVRKAEQPLSVDMKITLIEPTWNGAVHGPANLGALRMLKRAYPGAAITLVAGERHVEELSKIGAADVQGCCARLAITPALDADTMPRDLLATWQRLRGAPRQALDDADLVFMASVSATSLSLAAWQGWAGKAVAVLHGNASEVSGWRSRHPLRRALDLHASLRRFVARGGRVMVFEERVAAGLKLSQPWLAPALRVVGHPLLEEEARAARPDRSRRPPMHIAFAGHATAAKGYPAFLELAAAVHARHPGRYQFHALSQLHPSCRHLDQSLLSTRADQGWPRPAFVQRLAGMDYLFVWHDDAYYATATSGIVYDAINLGVPLLARRSPQIQALQDRFGPVGHSFDTVAQVIEHLCDEPRAETEYLGFVANLDRARQAQSTAALARQFGAALQGSGVP